MLRLRNPIPESVQDDEKLNQLIAGLKLVPYYGTTTYSSYSFLKLLYDLYELSTSHGACINTQRKYGFEGEIDLTWSRTPGLVSEQREMSTQDKQRLADDIQAAGLKFIDIVEFSQRNFVNHKVSGNRAYYYREIEVAGEKRVKIKPLHPLHFMYLYTDEMVKSVVITNHWTSEYLSDEEKHEVVRTYPDFTEKEDGRATVFHFMNKNDESDWYGRPDSIQSLLAQYAEFERDNHIVKAHQTELVAKWLITMEAPEPETDEQGDYDRAQIVKQKMKGLREITDNSGRDPKSMAVLEYPFGSNNVPTLEELAVDRDSAWLEKSSEILSGEIYEAHDWSKQLSGKVDTSGGINSNILKDVFMIKDETVIRPYQQMIQRDWSVIFKRMGEFLENENIANCTVQFPSKIENLIERIGDTTDDIGSHLVEQDQS